MPQVILPKKNAFNALRLICCLIVILVHSLDLSGMSENTSIRNVLDEHSCVCIFFILSGFFVTRSYINRKQKGECVSAFYLHRAKRILPSYYAVVLLCAFLFFFVSGATASQYFTSSRFWKYLFWNGIFLNFMCPSPVPKIGGGANV